MRAIYAIGGTMAAIVAGYLVAIVVELSTKM